jgi:TctA family transporter
MNFLLEALSSTFNPVVLAMLLFGVVVGLLVGALPGIGGVFAMALLLPLVDGFDISAVLGLLIGLTSVTTTSDTMPAVLIGVPGSAAAIATVEDGHPLARQGEGDRALGAAYSASLLGGLIGAFALALAIPVLRPLVLSLRTPDFLAVSVFGLLFVAVVAGRQPLKGLLAALVGLLLSIVGVDPLQGVQRFTFGNSYFWDGLSFTIVFVGLYGLVELADLLRRGRITETRFQSSLPAVLRGVRDTLREWRLVVASSLSGTFLGAVPGIGVTTIDWVAYGIAARDRKGGPEYGKGNIRGVIAPESANNAKEGGNLIPTLAIGLPGSIGMIFVLTVLSEHGIVPGPKMLTEHLPLVYSIVFFIAIANVLGTGICLLMTRQIAGLAAAPVALLVPVALALIVLGAYTTHLRPEDLLLLLLFGALGLLMKANGWSRAAFALGFLLGPNIERYYFLSAQLNGWAFLSRPAVIVVLCIVAGLIVRLALQGRLRPGALVFAPDTAGDRMLLALFAGLGALAFISALGFSGGSDMFPRIVASLLALVALPSILRAFGTPLRVGGGAAAVGAAKLLGFVGLLSGLVFMVGHLVAVPAFIFAASLLLDRTRWRAGLVTAAMSTAVIYLLFDELQHVSWPTPLITLAIPG